MRYLILFSLTAVLGFGFLLGCDNTLLPIENPPSDTTTPTGVAKSVETAINNNEMDSYMSLLSADYVFYFDPVEVGTVVDGRTIPETWDRDTDTAKISYTITNGVELIVNIDESGIGQPGKGSYSSPAVSFIADYQYSP